MGEGRGRVIWLTCQERRALLRVLQPMDRVVDASTHELVLYHDQQQTHESLRVRVVGEVPDHG